MFLVLGDNQLVLPLTVDSQVGIWPSRHRLPSIMLRSEYGRSDEWHSLGGVRLGEVDIVNCFA